MGASRRPQEGSNGVAIIASALGAAVCWPTLGRWKPTALLGMPRLGSNALAAAERKYGTPWEPHRLLGGKCAACGVLFGIIQLRHHCRRCGQIVCSDCQHSEQVSVAGSSHKKVVCKRCGVQETNGVLSPTSAETPSSKAGRADNLEDFISSTSPSALKLRTECTSSTAVAEVAQRTSRGSWEYVEGRTTTVSFPTTPKSHDDTMVEATKHHSGVVSTGQRMELIASGPQGVQERGTKTRTQSETLTSVDPDLDELYLKPCGGCGQRISDDFAVEALGETWHSSCFVCAWCSTPLSGMSPDPDDGEGATPFNFYFHGGSVYCPKDYMEQMCDKCSGCGFAVDQGISAMGATWHQECFVCAECNEVLDQGFYVVDGHPLCFKDKESQKEWMSQSFDFRAQRSMRFGREASADEREEVAAGVDTPQALGRSLSYGIFQALEASDTKRARHNSDELPDKFFKEHLSMKFDKSDENPWPFHFQVFAVDTFRHLRWRVFGVSEEEYRYSLRRPLSGGHQGEGKSGSVFFCSADQRYLLKSLTKEERPFFQKCLKDYFRHFVEKCPAPPGARCTDSLLPRFLGYYILKLPGMPAVNIIVMANVFPLHVELKERYDLKGVLGEKRFVTEDEISRGKKVLKDRNFVNRSAGGVIRVGQERKKKLLNQLSRDVEYLRDHMRIDYSLLLGVASAEDAAGGLGDWPTTDHGGLCSKDVDGAQGDEVYFMGIIDILEEYTVVKAMEGAAKTLRFRALHLLKESDPYANSTNAVSACSAPQYASRFLDFLESRMQ